MGFEHGFEVPRAASNLKIHECGLWSEIGPMNPMIGLSISFSEIVNL